MKRITLSLAALTFLLVAADTASAQTIRIVGGTTYYPSYSYGYQPYYAPPVYAYPPVYSVPSTSVYYSTPIGNHGRLSIGYSSGWGGTYSGYNLYTPSFRYGTSSYASPWGGWNSYYGGWRR